MTTRVTRPSAPSKRSSSSSPCTSIPCSSSRSWKNRPACSPNPRLSGDRLDHHDRARAAELGQRRRDLAGDVGAADQDDALAGGVLADRVAVAERPQVVDPLELAARDVQPADVRAGRDQRLAEARPPRLFESFTVRAARSSFIAEVRVSASIRCSSYHSARPEQRLLARLLALQVPLRARRPVVGEVGLAADQQDRAVGARLAQPARAVAGREPAADQR